MTGLTYAVDGSAEQAEALSCLAFYFGQNGPIQLSLTGGAPAIVETIQAIEDVGRWWP